MSVSEQKNNENKPRRRWESPTLKSVGAVTSVINGGGGKLSPTADDSGENRKPKGQA